MRVFFDTNVLVSAVAFGSRTCQAAVVVGGSLVTRLISEQVAIEARRTLTVKRRAPAVQLRALELLLAELTIVADAEALPDVEVRDPDDAIVLASAVAASADLLVTGDRDLLDVVDPPLRIVTPVQALALLNG